MKIIDIAICTDNKDPKGMGRIRCVDYNDFLSGKSSIKPNIVEWSEDDPFVALPFLPNNINFIPEVNQSVKILRYNTEKTTVNQEYVAGPFSTSFDFNGQTFSQQVKSTTYGIPVKSKKDIYSKEGKINSKSVGTLPDKNHFMVSGKYGSDVLFTTDGIVLRGGKLLAKDSANANERTELVEIPIKSKKTAKLHLKKYPKKYKKTVVTKEKEIFETADIKYVVEYTVDDFESPTELSFYVYRVKKNVYGDLLKSTNFTEFTDLSQFDSTVIELLNEDGNTTTPTKTVNLSSFFTTHTITDTDEKIKSVVSQIKTEILEMKEDGLFTILNSELKSKYDSDEELRNVYPFYFRPTEEFRTRTTSNSTEETRKQTLLNTIKLSARGPIQNGLVWSQTRITAPSSIQKENKEIYTVDESTREQTFGSMTADKIYLISTDTNFTDKTIDFEKLDPYEYRQTEDYLERIDPNTYSLVRGEILYNFLRAMYEVLTTHVHNINKPYARTTYDAHENLEQLWNKLSTELLNTSIRTN